MYVYIDFFFFFLCQAKDEEGPGSSVREWRRNSKRVKRNSYVETEPTIPPTDTGIENTCFVRKEK